MKTIIQMELTEFQQMEEMISAQQKTIEELKKNENIVLVDNRFNYTPEKTRWFSMYHIPKVVGNEQKAKEMMKQEFEELQGELEKYKNMVIKQEERISRRIRWW
jgi:hypothetical protein